MKYIISVDLGSTNYKALIMKIENDNLSIVGKVKVKERDFALFISDILKKYDIKSEEVEKLVVTGTGASYLKNNVAGIELEKVSEFDAIGYGGLILSKLEEAMVVSIGTGTAYVYSNLVKNDHLGGTGLGGGTLVGLGRKFLKRKDDADDITAPNFKALIDMAKKGKWTNVDLTIGDISAESIDDMSKDITAANFAAINKKASDDDYVAGIVNMILETIALMAKLYKSNLNIKDVPIVFVGTMVTDSFIQDRLKKIGEFTKDKYVFIDDADFAIAIGAYEYYLLRLRKVA